MRNKFAVTKMLYICKSLNYEI